jgi:hypothetical protein
MNYSELIQQYFERSTALQLYWTIYVLVIGGLLAFSSLRQRPDMVTMVLVTVLYAFFAYKNLGAIEDTTLERQAILSTIKEYSPSGPDVLRLRDVLEPTLRPTSLEGVRYFHVVSDLLTIALLWAMEWRRRKTGPPPGTGSP